MLFVLIIVREMYSVYLEISEKRRKVNTRVFRKWPHCHTMCLVCNGNDNRRGIVIQDKLSKMWSIKFTTEVTHLSDILGKDITLCYLSQSVLQEHKFFVMRTYPLLSCGLCDGAILVLTFQVYGNMSPDQTIDVWCSVVWSWQLSCPQSEGIFISMKKKNATKIKTVLAGFAAPQSSKCCLSALMMAEHSACRILPGKGSLPLFLSMEIDSKSLKITPWEKKKKK